MTPPTPTPTPSLGQIAYEAYYEYSGGKSLVSFHPLPTWDHQAPAICAAWEAAAQAVKEKTCTSA